MNELQKPVRPRAGAAAVQGDPDAPTVAEAPANVKPRLVAITCDGCGARFELSVVAVLNRFTVPCTECKWPAWTPRDCWPMDLPGGPLRPTLGVRP